MRSRYSRLISSLKDKEPKDFVNNQCFKMCHALGTDYVWDFVWLILYQRSPILTICVGREHSYSQYLAEARPSNICNIYGIPQMNNGHIIKYMEDLPVCKDI